jgi:hypothetical protein
MRLSWSNLALAIAFGAPLYILSSGPVLALAFWLREATGWDGFYQVMWVYYPILRPPPFSWAVAYVEWWTNLLGTVGPG